LKTVNAAASGGAIASASSRKSPGRIGLLADGVSSDTGSLATLEDLADTRRA